MQVVKPESQSPVLLSEPGSGDGRGGGEEKGWQAHSAACLEDSAHMEKALGDAGSFKHPCWLLFNQHIKAVQQRYVCGWWINRNSRPTKAFEGNHSYISTKDTVFLLLSILSSQLSGGYMRHGSQGYLYKKYWLGWWAVLCSLIPRQLKGVSTGAWGNTTEHSWLLAVCTDLFYSRGVQESLDCGFCERSRYKSGEGVDV